jgi:hypothetical protein
MLRRLSLLFGLVLAFAQPALGVTYEAATLAGVMLQPASSYYHFVYGGIAQLGFYDRAFLVRAGFAERPVFENAGFRDQDFVAFGLIGTQLKKSQHQNLAAYCGVAKVGGYVERIEASDSEANLRNYQIGGLMTAVEYKLVFKHFDIGVSHHAFVGYTSNEELQSYIAWPYNFAFLQIGTSW